MSFLKKYFPFSFGISEVAKLVISIIIYVVIGIIGGAIIGFLSGIAVIGWLFAIIGSLLEVYVVVGIVLAVLDFLKIIK